MNDNLSTESYHRRSIRLKGYDYSQNGAYFITICNQNRECLYGEIIEHKIILNNSGKMIDQQWNELHKRFNHIELDEYIIMPNHFHGIIVVDASVGGPIVGTQELTQKLTRAPTRGAPTIGTIVGAFKSITTNEYIAGIKNYDWQQFNKTLWQRNYYEHIIRHETSLNKIREYIIYNPINWLQDEMHQ